MKKIILLLAILFVAVSAFSLDVSVGIGGNIGLGFNSGGDWVYIENDFNSLILDYAGFIFFELKFNDYFAIQPEVGYNASMNILTDHYFGEFLYIDQSMISVPVYAKGILPINDISFYGKIGPTFNFLVGDIILSDDYGNSIAFEPINKFVVGVNAGIGVEAPIGPIALGAGLLLKVLPLDDSYSAGTIMFTVGSELFIKF